MFLIHSSSCSFSCLLRSIFTANVAINLWESSKPIDLAKLFDNAGLGFNLGSDGPDKPANGSEGFDTEDRDWDFFMFICIR
jgi:hypothetical protein